MIKFSHRIALAALLLPFALVTARAIPETPVEIALDADRGGVVIPLADHFLPPDAGTVAVRFHVTYFPSNGTLLDIGDGSGRNHLAIMERYEGDGTNRDGRFRLHVHDSAGAQQVLTSEITAPDREHTLAVTYTKKSAEFWLDGTKVGEVSRKLEMGVIDRLAVAEPLGMRWTRIATFDSALGGAELQKLAAAGDWRTDARVTFEAARDTAGTAAVARGRSHKVDAKKLAALLTTLPEEHFIYVDGQNGDDAGAGSASRPFRTINRAASEAAPGVTVLIKPGVYRESITLRKSGRKGAPIRFCSTGEGRVVVDGADVLTGFVFQRHVAGADIWVKPDYKTKDVKLGDERLIKILTDRGPTGVAQLERRGLGDTLWLDGQPVPKAETPGAMRPKTFWMDKEKNELLLALRPGDKASDHYIEAGARGTLFKGAVSYVTLRGLTLRRANSQLQIGVVDLTPAASNWVIEDCYETEGNFHGFAIRGWDHVLRGNIAERNGSEGIAGTLAQYLLFEDNISRQNNWRGINPDFTGGGGKFTQSHHVVIRRQTAAFNLGPGIWFDIGNSDIVVEDCLAHDNGAGIFMEISQGPFLIRNNVCFHNAGAGIVIGESPNATIAYNTLVENGSGIELRNLRGRTGLGLGVGDDEKKWRVKNINIHHNIMARNTTAGLRNSFVAINPAKDNIKSDHNLFFRNASIALWQRDANDTAMLSEAGDWIVPEGKTGVRLNALSAVRSELGFEKNSLEADPDFRFPQTHEYEADPDGPAGRLRAGHVFREE
jgi:hypothetical protein